MGFVTREANLWIADAGFDMNRAGGKYRKKEDKEKNHSMKNAAVGGSGLSPLRSLICLTTLDTSSLGIGW
jgi:hypothetical protein